MPRIPFVCLSVAALVVLAGCGSGTPGGQSPVAATSSVGSGTPTAGPSGSGPSSGSGSTTTDSTPPPETSGTEPAGPGQGGKPSIEVAGLPIGKNGLDGNCLSIAFLDTSTQAPKGMQLVVQNIVFTPRLIQTGGSDCSGSGYPACLEKYVPTADNQVCVVAIQPVGKPDGNASSEVTVVATLDCPEGQRKACLDYKSRLENDHQTFSVDVPEAPTSDTSTTDTSTTATSTTDTSTTGTSTGTDTGTAGSSSGQ